MSPSSSVYTQSPSPYSTQNPGSTSILGDSYEPNQSFSSPGSTKVTSEIFVLNNKMGHMDWADTESGTSSELEVTQALRRLEVQLSLNEDNFEDIVSFGSKHETVHDSNPKHDQRVISNQEQSAAFSRPDDQGLFYDGCNGRQGKLNKLDLLRTHGLNQ